MSNPVTDNSKLETRNPKQVISIIAAIAENGVIGANNRLPWHLPDDLRHFKRITAGHTVITGRRNYESIGRPLPDRRNIVVTRQPGFAAPGCIVVGSIEEALAAAGGDPEVFVIGGADIYRQTLARAQRLYLTMVHASPTGDTYFPEWSVGEWRELTREDHPADTRHTHAFTFVTLERRSGP
jgi:dihydrofolate reductase